MIKLFLIALVGTQVVLSRVIFNDALKVLRNKRSVYIESKTNIDESGKDHSLKSKSNDVEILISTTDNSGLRAKRQADENDPTFFTSPDGEIEIGGIVDDDTTTLITTTKHHIVKNHQTTTTIATTKPLVTTKPILTTKPTMTTKPVITTKKLGAIASTVQPKMANPTVQSKAGSIHFPTNAGK
jgi:hypothetical protein